MAELPKHPREIRLVSKTHRVVRTLVTTIDRATMAQGYQDAEYRLLNTFGWKLGKLLEDWKAGIFDEAWRATRTECGFTNVKDDDTLKSKLRKRFVETLALDYTPITAYFTGLAGMADKLALAQMRAEARRAVPNGDYDRSKGQWRKIDPLTLVHGATIRLRGIDRDVYSNWRLSRYAVEKLDAIGKLIVVALDRATPSAAKGVWLTKHYVTYRDSPDITGRLTHSTGPILATRSFKNGRFDVTFRSEADATAFAKLLREESGKEIDNG